MVFQALRYVIYRILVHYGHKFKELTILRFFNPSTIPDHLTIQSCLFCILLLLTCSSTAVITITAANNKQKSIFILVMVCNIVCETNT